MSIRLMTQIWDNADGSLTGSRLVIMLCLADHANDDGTCFPSVDHLAQRTRINRSNVLDHLRALEAAGYLTVVRTAGRRNTYIVHATGGATTTSGADATTTSGADATTTSGADATTTSGADATTTSGADATTPVARTPPESSVNHQINHQGNRQARPRAAMSSPQLAPAAPHLTTLPSAASGRNGAAKLASLNAQVPPAQRVPLAGALIDLCGKRALADSGTRVGDELVDEAQEFAATLYGMGFRTPEDLKALGSAWAEDWRGRGGGTFKQFVTFASEYKAGKIGAGNASSKRDSRFGLRRGNETASSREPTAEERAAFYAAPTGREAVSGV